MKKILFVLALTISLLYSCQKPDKENFSQSALKNSVIDLGGDVITIKQVLDQTKGKTTFIDLWASWCGDCRKSMPNVQALQAKYGNSIDYVFLSLDRKDAAWKKAVKKYQLKGNHYWLKGVKDWKVPGSFTQDIDLDWIPRYMIVGKDGTIKKFRAIHADDPKLIEAIEEDTKS